MNQLRLKPADTRSEDTHDVLPFPAVWSEMQSDRRGCDSATRLEDDIHRLQRQVDELQNEIDSVLHLRGVGENDWPPRAA